MLIPGAVQEYFTGLVNEWEDVLADVFGKPKTSRNSSFSFLDIENNIEEKEISQELERHWSFWAYRDIKVFEFIETLKIVQLNLMYCQRGIWGTEEDNLIKTTQLVKDPQPETGLCTVFFKTKQN